MTFDEFLTSNETIFKFKEYENRKYDSNILKIKFNDNLDFLYKPDYRRIYLWA